MSWHNGLYRRNFIHSCDGEMTSGDRIGLMPTDLRPSLSSVTGWRNSLPRRKDRRKITLWVILIAVLTSFAFLTGYLVRTSPGLPRPDRVPDPDLPLPPSFSKLRVFRRAAVCTDGAPCSQIGRDILLESGTAVDAAVGAAFCNGLFNMASMGAGGGFFMTVYIKSEERAYAVNSREMAPRMAHKNMFKTEAQSMKGGLAVAVPGELRGLWTIHKRWGQLPWKRLVEPSMRMCQTGFNMSKVQRDAVDTTAPRIMADPQLRKMFFDEKSNKFYAEGSLVKPSEQLCRTLSRIADQGVEEFYTGTIAKDLVADIREAGGIITEEDLRNFGTNITDPITIQLRNGDTLFTPPPPSSGVLLGIILNTLSGYNFTDASISTLDKTVLTYHRIIEAFKYAYATRSHLGDLTYLPELRSLLNNVTSAQYAELVRSKIDDARTVGDASHYGAVFSQAKDAGTAHMSIIAPNGDAVSVTSSINYYFGAGFAGNRTGIIFNNVMDDFSSPNFPNYFGFPPSPANFIKGGKRPLSSMSPSIIVDKNMNARMVIGASGGSKISTATAFVLINNLWFGRSIKESVDTPRIHHQLMPPTVEYEYGNIASVIDGLKALGHNMTRYRDRGSIVCALHRNSSGIFGNADFRKGGDVYGYD